MCYTLSHQPSSALAACRVRGGYGRLNLQVVVWQWGPYPYYHLQ
jgi:hypothetical protein